MNTSYGWVKLYRCLLEDAVCQRSAYFHLWVTLLMMPPTKTANSSSITKSKN
jgi:hypothetical protein